MFLSVFVENVSNTVQDIVLTMFRDAHTDAHMDEQGNNSMPPATIRWA